MPRRYSNIAHCRNSLTSVRILILVSGVSVLAPLGWRCAVCDHLWRLDAHSVEPCGTSHQESADIRHLGRHGSSLIAYDARYGIFLSIYLSTWCYL